MEALVDRRHKELPQDFMLAEDTFLNLILVDETFMVESGSHGYRKGEKHEGGSDAVNVQTTPACLTPCYPSSPFFSSPYLFVSPLGPIIGHSKLVYVVY